MGNRHHFNMFIGVPPKSNTKNATLKHHSLVMYKQNRKLSFVIIYLPVFKIVCDSSILLHIATVH